MADDEEDDAAWSAPDSDPPDHRCGFELLPADVGIEEEFENLSEWRDGAQTASCCREAVINGRCRWHADVDADVMREAVATRDDRAQNLDGVLLRDVELQDIVSFETCRLRGATFDSVSAEQADFCDADLRGAEFPDADLRWTEFPHADLRGAEFPDADLPYAEFPDADLRWTEFPDADLRDAEFCDADLRYAEFPDADLFIAEFRDADLRYAKFPDADLREAEFPHADLREAEFPHADLREAEFPHADLLFAEFPHAHLRQAEFPDADLSGVRFPDADLSGVRFPDADLYKAEFPHAYLYKAEFPHAYLYKAEFPHAYLRYAEFPDANLRDVNFSEADLHNSNLTGATLDNSNATGASFTRATFTRASADGANFTNADFSNAKLNGTAITDANLNDTLITPGTDFRHPVDGFGMLGGYEAATWHPTVHDDVDTPRVGHRDHVPTTVRTRHARSEGIECTADTLGRPSDTGLSTPSGESDLVPEAPPLVSLRRGWHRFRHWASADPDDHGATHDRLDKAINQYRSYEQLHRENSLPADVPTFYVRAKHCQRKQALLNAELSRDAEFRPWLRWLKLATQRWLMGYGERPGRVIVASLAVVFVSAALFPLLGRIENTGGTELPVGLKQLYFSVVTFTTLGYGDFSPAGTGAQLLAGVEALVGAVMIALLVAVFTRRAMR